MSNYQQWVRRIIGILLIAFVASQLFWAGRVFSRVWNFPELRHQVTINTLAEDDLNSAQLAVVNLGFGSAGNVFVHISTHGLRIHSYSIDAQESYEIRTLDQELHYRTLPHK